jgi:Fic family protein
MDKFMGMNTESLIITPEILALISEMDEFKGAWKALGQLAPEQLNILKQVATIESIGSSTRIEGSKLSDKEVELLLSNLEIKHFSSRDEQEVAGYAETMNIVFQHFAYIPLSENYIKELHQRLLQYSEKDDWHRGNYKKSPNHVEAFDATGRSLGIIFETASPFETTFRMQHLVSWAVESLKEQQLHPLLIISLFIVEFLAIHPFQDGNGRLSRILTVYLLLKAGYTYTPYSSIEAVIEQNKESYYLSLRQTQGTLQSDNPNWQPWVLFFLRTLQQQKERLNHKLEEEHILSGQLPSLSAAILALVKKRTKMTVRELVILTGANRNTIKKHLESLVINARLEKKGIGKGTWYEFKR